MSRLDTAAAEAALAALANIIDIEYADVRVTSEETDRIDLRNDDAERVARTGSTGLGVRVLRRGAWGFAATPLTSHESAAACAKRAAEIAAGVAAVQTERVYLAEEEPQVGQYHTPVEIDPFEVPLERRLLDLRRGLDAMRGPDLPAIKSVAGSMRWSRTHKLFLSTEGSRVAQTLVFGGAGIKVVAADDLGVVQRSWPMSVDGGLAACGYELIDELALADNGARLRQEVLALLTAPPCPAGPTTLVLDTPQLAVQIHDSCGHPSESDRVQGADTNRGGASFLTPDRLGRFTYGTPLVNLTADSRAPRGLGTCGWDDEGVPARTTPLVARGVLVGYLSSRQTAASLSLGRSAGCMRAESWNHPPIVQMINVSLEPTPDGPSSLDELIADTDHGLLMDQSVSRSLDDTGLNFKFGCEAAWQIKNGVRGQMYRNPVYTGSTPAFWRSCDAIGNQDSFRMWGIASCGKGEPMQTAYVGHGCAPARFRSVDAGAS